MSHYTVADENGKQYCAYGLVKAEERPNWNNHLGISTWVMVNGSTDIIQHPDTTIVMLPREEIGNFWMRTDDVMAVVKDTQPNAYLAVSNAIRNLLDKARRCPSFGNRRCSHEVIHGRYRYGDVVEKSTDDARASCHWTKNGVTY